METHNHNKFILLIMNRVSKWTDPSAVLSQKQIILPLAFQYSAVLKANQLALPVPAIVLKFPDIDVIILIEYFAAHKVPRFK